MIVRPMEEGDLQQLRDMAYATGFEYADPVGPQIEAVFVVEGDDGKILMAAAAERIVQAYLWTGNFAPGAKLHAIRMLHSAMGAELKAKGYTEINAFLPPQIERQFGRRLERSFGWRKNWSSWWKGV